MAPDAPESFRIPKFQTATWDQMCSGPLGHCEALVTNIAKRRHLLQSVTALSPWTAKIEATDEVHWPSRVLRWGTETSTTMAKNSTSTSTRSRTRPSGSFIWFHIIIHVFAPTLVDFGWPFSGKTWSMSRPWTVSNCILLQKTCHTAPCSAPCHQANPQNLSIQWWPQTPCLAHEASSPSHIMHLDARE